MLFFFDSMKCKICSGNSEKLFNTLVLNKYNVQYFKCNKCHFIQTEEVFWLPEAYENAIGSLDIGYATRNVMYSEIVAAIIQYIFKNKDQRFLDYGGGYGLFVRLMRDKGFDFYRQDSYCENIFAKHFDVEDLNDRKGFGLLTAFEVFEHLVQPLEEVSTMLRYSDAILFSTELQPSKNITNVDDWWYFVPEGGQHVALYSLESLQEIARKFNLHLISNKHNLHLLSKRKHHPARLKLISVFFNLLNRLLGRHFASPDSLLLKDFQMLKSKQLHG
jgi:hypothetical protein